MPRQVKKSTTTIKGKSKNHKGKSYKKPKVTRSKPKKARGGGHTHKVSFNLRKNHVEKYYCPDLVNESFEDESPQIDLDSIEDFPEISLNDLLSTV